MRGAVDLRMSLRSNAAVTPVKGAGALSIPVPFISLYYSPE